MIALDTGPLVALFDPADGDHAACVAVLRLCDEPLVATIPVLTEAVHLLSPGSIGARRLADFIADGGVRVWFFSTDALTRPRSITFPALASPLTRSQARPHS